MWLMSLMGTSIVAPALIWTIATAEQPSGPGRLNVQLAVVQTLHAIGIHEGKVLNLAGNFYRVKSIEVDVNRLDDIDVCVAAGRMR
jgi:hypothetical protein